MLISSYISDINKFTFLKKNELSSNKNTETEDSNIIINEDEFEIINPIQKEESLQNKNNVSDESENFKKFKIINKNPSEEEELRFDFLKNYTKLRPEKGETFLERMKFDIDNRKIKEEKMNEFINKTKLKMSEKERIKGFNNLIKDANRRIEAKKNIMIYNENKIKEEQSNKKYNKEEWDDIYRKRFCEYLDNKNKKIKEKITEKEIKEKKKEDYIISLNKTKKKPEKIILQYCKKMYSEFMKKKERILNMQNNLHVLENQKNKPLKNNNDIYKRNKSVGNNKLKNKKKNLNINTNNNVMEKDKNWKIMNNIYLTPTSYLANKKEYKYGYKCNEGIHDEINCHCFEKGSISEALFNNFFSNKKRNNND